MSATGSNITNEKIIEYIKKNKFLAISVPILLVLIVIMIYVYASMANKDNIATSIDTNIPKGIDTTNSKSVEVLPQTERAQEATSDNNIFSKPAGDPFSGPIVLKGTIIGDNGNNKALVDAGGISYIVSKNDSIADTWTVQNINKKEVFLKSGSKELKLTLTEKDVSSTGQTNSK